jgi:hypothetical protein
MARPTQPKVKAPVTLATKTLNKKMTRTQDLSARVTNSKNSIGKGAGRIAKFNTTTPAAQRIARMAKGKKA